MTRAFIRFAGRIEFGRLIQLALWSLDSGSRRMRCMRVRVRLLLVRLGIVEWE